MQIQVERAMILHSTERQPYYMTVNHTFKTNQEEEFTCSQQTEMILFGETGMFTMVVATCIPTSNYYIVHE